ncbi:SDR family NAD(P)-dependent oxidoreductase [Agrococcus jenensis]|uniref:Short-subunit dehydrogenase n=1 Tax=Agrococcus jenensis TaxID=46353 RepID=A0A3N2ANT8_9MICO|nr:SDR family NAD(P)-dependent oxidoreductase [Agrococcus jenensis]ROR64719.1 short-subunit dehydrogenase [Agrococcus jenensis]
MDRILVTGSIDGVGRATAEALLEAGHGVVVHARTTSRLDAIQHLVDRGAEAIVGDLSRLDDVHDMVVQANALGPFDAVIHNAGVLRGPVLPVNVTAPYVMTAGIPGSRLIYLSSGMHRGGRPDIAGIDWLRETGTSTYSDSKLFVTALMAAVARLRPDVVAHAVDPGWVPTRMGGPGASDDLALAHVTQVWLATTIDDEARTSGRYWHHRKVQETHPAVHDVDFQHALLASLAEQTGIELAAAR